MFKFKRKYLSHTLTHAQKKLTMNINLRHATYVKIRQLIVNPITEKSIFSLAKRNFFCNRRQFAPFAICFSHEATPQIYNSARN